MNKEDLRLNEVCGGGAAAVCGTLALGTVSVSGVALAYDGFKRICEKDATIGTRVVGALEAVAGCCIALDVAVLTYATALAGIDPKLVQR